MVVTVGLKRGGRVASAALVACLSLLAGGAWAQASDGFASTRPTPRIEYWQKRLIEIDAHLEAPESLAPVKLLFLGDSITDFWTMGDNPWFPGAFGGRAVWNETFDGTNPENLALNLGISGDRTEHVLQRILPKSDGGLGELDRSDLDPDVVVLLIGINNSWDAETPAVSSIVDGVRAVVASVHARKPRALIVLQSLLPTNEPARNAEVVMPVNALLADFAAQAPQTTYVRYLDIHTAFLGPDALQDRSLFMDGVHPNERGYRAWRDRLVPFLAEIRR
jgi:lysophospholipase L1-like esterase